MSRSPTEQALRREIQELREALGLLRVQVDKHEEQISDHSSQLEELSQVEIAPSVSEAGTIDQIASVLDSPPRVGLSEAAPRVVASSSASYSVVTSQPETSAVGGGPSWEFREAVARDIGQFLRRGLDNRHRGPSGRQRLSQLPSSHYLICRDFSGRLYQHPVKVTTSFAEVKALCSQQGSFGNSVFVGVPSLREGKIAVLSAGLDWPESLN